MYQGYSTLAKDLLIRRECATTQGVVHPPRSRVGARLESPAMRNRRKSTRYLFGVAAKLSEAGTANAAEMILTNVSLHGCCAEGGGSLAVGQMRLLAINWRGTEIPVKAEVIWADTQGRAGFRFLSVAQKHRGLLSELCSTLKIQSAVRAPTEAA